MVFFMQPLLHSSLLHIMQGNQFEHQKGKECKGIIFYCFNTAFGISDQIIIDNFCFKNQIIHRT